MGIQNQNFAVNRIGGFGQQGIFEESSTPKFPVGQIVELSNGNRYRYGYTGAAIAAGLLVSQDLSATSLVETNNIVIAAASGFDPAAGSKQFQITLASVTLDQYSGALLQITDDAGEGHQYRIKSNSATGATTSGKVDIYLYDGIKVALTTASDIAIVGELWSNVVGATAATDYVISGVTTMAMTSGYYGWFQTAGVATILADGTIAIGDNLTLSDGVTGAVQLKDAETEPLVGFAAYAPDNTGHVGVVIQGLVA